MKQLSKSKKKRLFSALKAYRRKYLVGKYKELDEAATRLLVNTFLTDILGFVSLDEIKTEYMIRGTYADYVIQLKGKRFFIVEAKAMSIELSAKHLRQAVNYAANEGIEWALLTNGRVFEFYKILFQKPIESRKVFTFDLSNEQQIKIAVEFFQYLSKSLIAQRGLEYLWSKVSALDATNLSRLLYAEPIIRNLKKLLKRTCKSKFSDDDIIVALTRVIEDKVENVRPIRQRRAGKKRGRRVVSDKQVENQIVSSIPLPS